MSGHSKWATIKHKKAATDAKKGKAFSMISKMITVAVREGGSGDPTQNPRLRLAIDKARDVNMPKANVDKAIEKGLGRGGGEQVSELIYEGFGPHGIGIMVKVLTDNRNRSSSEIKQLFDKHGGTFAGPGAVSYMFSKNPDGTFAVVVPMPISEAQATSLQDFLDRIDDHDDVEWVITNHTVA